MSELTHPVELTDGELDAVAAGALLTVLAIDVVDINNNDVDVAVPINAAVAANVLGGIALADARQPGRIQQ